ncbi:MAG: hypothetical protein RIT45_624 [Pseudomonadota bacterium]|jgi:hypothetical protein
MGLVPAPALAVIGDPVPLPAGATTTAAPDFGRPPFDAWLDAGAYWPRRGPEKRALAAGVLRRGDGVRVLGCLPRCDHPRAMAAVEGGAVVPLRLLRPLPRPPEIARQVDDDALLRGRVIAWRAAVYDAPRTSAKRLRKERLGYLVAFVVDPAAPEGWLRRWQGGWMRARDVKLLQGSDFTGQDAPELPMAFTLHTIRAAEVDGGETAADRDALLARRRKTRKGSEERAAIDTALQAHRIERQSAFGGVRLDRGRVRLADGRRLPRWKVRVAWPRVRPARIPADALWLHIDLEEQTMVVYRGDRPLRATLVSTGKPGTSTRPGLYRALSKVRIATMSGRVPEPYVAEAVPFVIHFYQGQALHGAWWHDGFGTVRSHGCVNVPPADARWLFELAHPPLPAGWRGVLLSHGDPRPHILIEAETPRAKRRLREPAEAPDDRRCVERRTGSRLPDCPFDAFEGNAAEE